MLHIFAITIILLFAPAVNNEPLTIDYYKNLIGQNIAEADSYTLPNRNIQFLNGSTSEKIKDYKKKYDFIIVGAGTAGSVLATRLSEYSYFNILLLEAGNKEDYFSKIPNMAVYSQFSEKNWGYYSTTQKECCLGMVNQKCIIPRGKVLGGSSAISFQIYQRTSKSQYQEWSQGTWSYSTILNYYKKSENSQIDGDENQHGKMGPLNDEYPKPNSELQPLVIKANAEVGVRLVDYNGRQNLGVSKPQINIKHGLLQSTSTAFLDNARNRQNIDIINNALVIKLLANTAQKRVEGVVFVTKEGKYRVFAKKEVILSAGPINTPQLLMLSGIGPKNHLQEKGIPVVQNLPVGQNLIDKVLFPGLIFRTNKTVLPDTNISQTIAQFLEGEGPLTKPLFIDLIEFLSNNNISSALPDFELLIVPQGRTSAPILQRMFNYNDTVTKKFLQTINTTTDMVIHLILSRPKSRGAVALNSSDPIDHPLVNVNYFHDQSDVTTLIKSIRFVTEKLTKTQAFQQIGATRVHFDLCGNEQESDTFWECALRTLAVTGYELSGTTPMGANKATSVVDTKLLVHGFKNLRVVDAGIFGSFGASEADTIMAAEKIADVIKTTSY